MAEIPADQRKAADKASIEGNVEMLAFILRKYADREILEILIAAGARIKDNWQAYIDECRQE